MFKNELSLIKLINIYFSLKLNMILIKNLILNQENCQVKDNSEQLKNVKVNQIYYIMQLNLLNKVEEQWI